MYGCLGDDVGVQTVAEVDRVDVIAMMKDESASRNQQICMGPAA